MARDRFPWLTVISLTLITLFTLLWTTLLHLELARMDAEIARLRTLREDRAERLEERVNELEDFIAEVVCPSSPAP